MDVNKVYGFLVVSMQFSMLMNSRFRIYTETVSHKYSHDSHVLQQRSAIS